MSVCTVGIAPATINTEAVCLPLSQMGRLRIILNHKYAKIEPAKYPVIPIKLNLNFMIDGSFLR